MVMRQTKILSSETQQISQKAPALPPEGPAQTADAK